MGRGALTWGFSWIVFTKSDSSVKVGGTKWFKVVNRLPGPQEGVGVALKHAPGGSRVGRALVECVLRFECVRSDDHGVTG